MPPRLHDHLEHVGFIPDGTRRWASANGVDKKQAYRLAAQKLIQVIDWLFEQHLRSVSVYLLSKDNLNRPPEDLEAVLSQIEYFYGEGLSTLITRWQVNIRHAGVLGILPFDAEKRIQRVFPAINLSSNSDRWLYLCLGYDPLDELAQALEPGAGAGDFWERLWVPDSVDLVIRTAGDTTLSNFLPLQSGYARLFSIDQLLLDVTNDDLSQALEWFRALARRFGK